MRSSARLSFVGRSYESGLLDSALAEARAGTPTLVWIEGPAGIGKTALVRSFLARAYNVLTLWATASQADPVTPWETLAQLLVGAPDTMADQVSRVRVATRTMTADVSGLLVELFQALLGTRGVIVAVVDNVDCADSASTEALRSALRHLEDARLLFVATADTGPGRAGSAWWRATSTPCASALAGSAQTSWPSLGRAGADRSVPQPPTALPCTPVATQPTPPP